MFFSTHIWLLASIYIKAKYKGMGFEIFFSRIIFIGATVAELPFVDIFARIFLLVQ